MKRHPDPHQCIRCKRMNDPACLEFDFGAMPPKARKQPDLYDLDADFIHFDGHGRDPKLMSGSE